MIFKVFLIYHHMFFVFISDSQTLVSVWLLFSATIFISVIQPLAGKKQRGPRNQLCGKSWMGQSGTIYWWRIYDNIWRQASTGVERGRREILYQLGSGLWKWRLCKDFPGSASEKRDSLWSKRTISAGTAEMLPAMMMYTQKGNLKSFVNGGTNNV